jgi:hypothetical protein
MSPGRASQKIAAEVARLSVLLAVPVKVEAEEEREDGHHGDQRAKLVVELANRKHTRPVQHGDCDERHQE